MAGDVYRKGKARQGKARQVTIRQEIDKARRTRKRRKKLAVVHWLDSENIAATNTNRPNPINTMAGPWRGVGRGGEGGARAPLVVRGIELARMGKIE